MWILLGAVYMVEAHYIYMQYNLKDRAKILKW